MTHCQVIIDFVILRCQLTLFFVNNTFDGLLFSLEFTGVSKLLQLQTNRSISIADNFFILFSFFIVKVHSHPMQNTSQHEIFKF